MISINNLSKSFYHGSDRVNVLNDITLNLVDGQISFLTGPNGIGKTVLAKCISGIMPFDKGNIIFEKEYYNSTTFSRDHAAKIGIEYVPQLLYRPPNINGFEFLSLNSINRFSIYSKKQILSLLSSIESEFGLTIKINLRKSILTLTFPELQMLYIMQTLIGGVNLLILDEPTAYLEINEIHQLENILLRLKEKGKTIIVIAHPEHYKFTADKLLQLTSSGIKEDGESKSNVYYTPPERRLHGYKCFNIILKCSNIKIESGHAVLIEGPTTRSFYNYADYLGLQHQNVVSVESEEKRKYNTRWRYISFDATDSALISQLSILENTLINHWNDKRWIKYGSLIMYKVASRLLVENIVTNYNIAPNDPNLPVYYLSGGNRQKLVIGRECFGDVDVLIACGIFRALDDKSITTVIRQIERKLADGMIAVFLTTRPGSEDLIADIKYKFVDGNLLRA